MKFLLINNADLGNTILQLNDEERCLLPSVLSAVNKTEVADVPVCRIEVKWCMML